MPLSRVKNQFGMHHFRRILAKSSHKSDKNDISIKICSSYNTKCTDIGVSEAGPWRLPTELIALIIDNVPDRRDLASVCRASKTLNAIAEPLLYGKIQVNSEIGYIPGVYMDGHQMLALHKSILGSDRSSLVTDFCLYLQNWQIRCEWGSTKPGTRPRCHCDEYDDTVGNILSLLHSLRSLRFHCDLCRKKVKNRHGYLPRLDFPCLAAFRFVCYCSLNTSRSHEIIRTAPYMTTVTTLSLDWTCDWPIAAQHPDQPTVIEEGTLPNVTAMIHNDTALADLVVCARPISRICSMKSDFLISGYPHSLHHAVEASPGRLTHLYVIDILNGLAGFLLESPRPYRHLTAIGTLLFKSYKYTEVLDDLSSLGTLESLESIEVARGMLSKPPGGSFICSIPEFRSTLSDRHPFLCKILVTSRETIASDQLVGTELWKKVVSEWVYRNISHFSYWEVLNGAYENICE